MTTELGCGLANFQVIKKGYVLYVSMKVFQVNDFEVIDSRKKRAKEVTLV